MKKKLPVLSFLFFFSLFLAPWVAYSEDDMRTVNVIAIIDKDDGSLLNATAIATALSFSSDELEKNFRVKLQLKFIPMWNFPAGKKELEAETAYADIIRISSQTNADFVIAYTTKPIYRIASYEIDGEFLEVREYLGGYAFILGKAALVRIDQGINISTLHEIYHIFGAEDIRNTTEESIMRIPAINNQITRLDKKNFERIMANRLRSFSGQ